MNRVRGVLGCSLHLKTDSLKTDTLKTDTLKTDTLKTDTLKTDTPALKMFSQCHFTLQTSFYQRGIRPFNTSFWKHTFFTAHGIRP